MRLFQFVFAIFWLFSWSNLSYSISCVQPDWDDELCGLPDLPGSRCVHAKFFRTYCEKATVGCQDIPGGCIGNTPVGHWYAITNEEGVPKYKCRCGCFASETIFTRGTGEEVTGFDVIGVYKKENEAQFTVSSLDSFDSNSFTDRQINAVAFGSENEESLAITTVFGKKITVSKAHPLVLGNYNGKLLAMKAAEEVKVGDYLIAKSGDPEQIARIDKVSYDGKMVNFNVVSDKAENHVVEANGVMAGDQGWQDRLSSVNSRIIWRNDILKFLSKKGQK